MAFEFIELYLREGVKYDREHPVYPLTTTPEEPAAALDSCRHAYKYDESI
ncbi:hypothetical protein GCM10007418_17740 [Halopseudomonas salina]|uniref:Uncharacterized protein n=1 Tax=Halopseudomonas salina TaxID=1323744 RepID=A0ABQ1PKX9_9GAMM|nr:hypothetical protein GCM10007418_17740 [Halopseudomonas salina]